MQVIFKKYDRKYDLKFFFFLNQLIISSSLSIGMFCTFPGTVTQLFQITAMEGRFIH